MSNSELIAHLVQTNNPLYNLSKIAEECGELNTVILQSINKGETGPDKNEIIEEIGDLAIRLEIAKAIYGEKEVNDRIQFKLDKYKGYVKDGLYAGRI